MHTPEGLHTRVHMAHTRVQNRVHPRVQAGKCTPCAELGMGEKPIF